MAVGSHLADLVLGSLTLLFDLGELFLLPLVTLADLLVPLLIVRSVLSGEVPIKNLRSSLHIEARIEQLHQPQHALADEVLGGTPALCES